MEGNKKYYIWILVGVALVLGVMLYYMSMSSVGIESDGIILRKTPKTEDNKQGQKEEMKIEEVDLLDESVDFEKDAMEDDNLDSNIKESGEDVDVNTVTDSDLAI